MLTFEEYLTQAAAKGEGINLVFEQRLFELVEVLHRITDTLTAADIPHEVIGGLAVFTSYWVDVNSNRALFYDRILRILAQDPNAAANHFYHDAVALNVVFQGSTVTVGQAAGVVRIVDAHYRRYR